MNQISFDQKNNSDRAVALMLLARYKHQLRKPALLEEKNAIAEKNFKDRKAIFPCEQTPHSLIETLSPFDLQVLEMSWIEWLGFNERPDLINQISEEELKNYNYYHLKTKSKMANEPNVEFIQPKEKNK